AAGGGDRDARSVRDLARATFAPELDAGLVQEAEAVEPSARELTPVRVERDLAVERDRRAAFEEAAALALRAEAERLEPRERDEADAVVELRHVDVGGTQLRTLPQHRGGVAQRHRGQVVELVPRRATAQRGPDRLDPDRRAAEIARGVDVRDDHRGGAV